MLLIYIAPIIVCSTTAASEFSVVTSGGSVSEPLGSSAVLPCHLSPSINAETFAVQWYKNNYKNLILGYEHLKVQENTGDPRYRDRVSLIGELEKGNVSLQLKNLTLADRGEYLCYVKSLSWYESAKVNLMIRVPGSTPLLKQTEAGDQVNVTCESDGWSPKPTLTWKDRGGRVLRDSHIYYKIDSKGLVNMTSWLLSSPSSEWISCSVGISDQEMKERIVELNKRFQDQVFILTLVLSLIMIICIIIIIIIAAVLVKRGLLPHGLSRRNTTASGSPPSVHPDGSAEERMQIMKLATD